MNLASWWTGGSLSGEAGEENVWALWGIEGGGTTSPLLAIFMHPVLRGVG